MHYLWLGIWRLYPHFNIIHDCVVRCSFLFSRNIISSSLILRQFPRRCPQSPHPQHLTFYLTDIVLLDFKALSSWFVFLDFLSINRPQCLGFFSLYPPPPSDWMTSSSAGLFSLFRHPVKQILSLKRPLFVILFSLLALSFYLRNTKGREFSVYMRGSQ